MEAHSMTTPRQRLAEAVKAVDDAEFALKYVMAKRSNYSPPEHGEPERRALIQARYEACEAARALLAAPDDAAELRERVKSLNGRLFSAMLEIRGGGPHD